MEAATNLNSVEKAITIDASLDLVWYAWTLSDRVSEWFAPETVIDAKEGGSYELYFIPGNKSEMNTQGCKITKLVEKKELQFTWKGPDQFNDLMNNEEDLTVVHVSFEAQSESVTEVIVTHTGFKDGDHWQDAINWHNMAWSGVLESLKSALENGQGNLCCTP